jgi:diadenosine tetraphosphate (Ap4A) HIT family hydrolase
MSFVLDPRLMADTLSIGRLNLCDVLAMNDVRYPWAILVPRISGARDLHELDEADRNLVWAETNQVALAIADWQGVTKVNIGALGNIVSQLHVHVVGRNISDPAWPGPVWGHSPRVPYADQKGFIEFLKKRL